MIIIAYIASLVFFLVISHFLIIRKGRFKGDFTNPLFLFFLFFSLTYFALPLFQILSSSFRYSESYTDSAYFYALVYLLTFSFFVFITYLLVTKRINFQKVRSTFNVDNWNDSDDFAKFAVLIIILFPVGSVIIYFIQYIQNFGYEQYLANRIILLSGKGYLITILLWIIPSVVFFVVYLFKKKEKEKKRGSFLVIILLLLLAIIPGIILGSRTNLLLPLFFITSSIAILKTNGYLNNIKRTLLLITPIILIVSVGLWLEGYRQSLMSGQIVESSKLITQLSGGFGTAENIYWWFDNTNGKLFYGSTLISIFVGFIPRSIWLDKPFGGGPTLVNTMFPGRYNQSTGENISSYTTGFPFEFMMNFGFSGAIIGGIIFGILLSITYYFRGKITNSIQFVTWLMIIYCAFSLLHGEIFGITAKLIGLVLPLFVVNFITKLYRGSYK